MVPTHVHCIFSLNADYREAAYENLRLADADVACRFGDTRFTQGSDSASFLAGLGDAVGGLDARYWAGYLQMMCGRRAGLAGSRAGAREGAVGGVTGTRAAIWAILGGKERCIAYETIYN